MLRILFVLVAALSLAACYGGVPSQSDDTGSSSDVTSGEDASAVDSSVGPETSGDPGNDGSGSGTGAGDDDDAAASDEMPAEILGHVLYESPIKGGNTFACATCHSLEEPAADGIRRIGHPIGDASARPTWKNGQLDSFLAAVNSCRDEWMNLEPWVAEDAEWEALRDFLADHAPDGEAEPVTFTIVDPPDDSSGGDADAGQATFNATCSACHGVDGGGSMRGPPLAGVGYPADFVVSKVRTSGPADSGVYDELAGGIMPFWGGDRLSDTELLDIAAWLAASEAPDPPPVEEDMSMPEEDGGRTEGSDCASSHPKVGWSTELSTLFHMVEGTATIVDDCTIEITDFVFDGNGIDVRIYGGNEGNYHAGPVLSDDLYNWPVGYDHVTLTVRLPDGVTFDDFDGISVWCVAVGTSFGDGIFMEP